MENVDVAGFARLAKRLIFVTACALTCAAIAPTEWEHGWKTPRVVATSEINRFSQDESALARASSERIAISRAFAALSKAEESMNHLKATRRFGFIVTLLGLTVLVAARAIVWFLWK